MTIGTFLFKREKIFWRNIFFPSYPPIIMPLDNIVRVRHDTSRPTEFSNRAYLKSTFVSPSVGGAVDGKEILFLHPPAINHRVCYSFTPLPTFISQWVCQVFVRSTAPPPNTHPPIRLRLFVRRFWRETGVVALYRCRSSTTLSSRPRQSCRAANTFPIRS